MGTRACAHRGRAVPGSCFVLLLDQTGVMEVLGLHSASKGEVLTLCLGSRLGKEIDQAAWDSPFMCSSGWL